MIAASIINGAVEHMPQKTKGGKTASCLRIIEQPDKSIGGEICRMRRINRILFPFINSQKYNVAIKKIFSICGVDRLVTILTPHDWSRSPPYQWNRK